MSPSARNSGRFFRSLASAAALPGLLLLLPVLLRRPPPAPVSAQDQVVIISPHNEAIRHEFERAFCAWYRKKTGRSVRIDWRIPGGTSEIVRYIRSEYLAAFRLAWRRGGHAWNGRIAAAVLNRKLKKGRARPDEWAARNAFLHSNTGIGIDLFFGGGQYEFGKMAATGILVPCGVRRRHPGWFSGPHPVFQQRGAGEIWYDPGDRYYGACLAAFGICYNLDRWREFRFPGELAAGPRTWSDLGRPALLGRVGVADPSKSGSITKAFEMLIQQQIAQSLRDAGLDPRKRSRLSDARTLNAVSHGWEQAMTLIKKIGANARYFTFSASKVPVDVGDGVDAAGMCIDFYGRGQAEWMRRHAGREVMRYITPAGGSSISADPIGLLRGAPHPETARAFIDFVLSKTGQRLWDYRAGTPGGPETYTIRRLPIRRDVYTAADRRFMADPEARPFALANQFMYHPEWTARYFGLIRILIRVMVIDCHDELEAAWRALIAAGGPEKAPKAALRAFEELPFAYPEAGGYAKQLADTNRRIVLTRHWAAFFRNSYRRTRELARRTSTD